MPPFGPPRSSYIPETLFNYDNLVELMRTYPTRRMLLLQEAINSLPLPYFTSQVAYFWYSLSESIRTTGDQSLWTWLRTIPEIQQYLPNHVRRVEQVTDCRRIERPLTPGTRERIKLPGYPFRRYQQSWFLPNWWELFSYVMGTPID